MKIQTNFKSLDAFEDKFVEQGVKHFGSGWVWLVQSHGKLSIQTTHDAETPLKHNMKAILGCDLWEHAYYLDYRNERQKFLEKFFRLVNWDFVSDNFKLSAEEDAA